MARLALLAGVVFAMTLYLHELGAVVRSITLEQWLIMATGVPAVFLSQSKEPKIARWACIAGLMGQPGWFVAAYEAGQAGVLFISILYSAAWAKGIYTYWITPWRTNKAR